jgi:hypothetical protein
MYLVGCIPKMGIESQGNKYYLREELSSEKSYLNPDSIAIRTSESK